MEQSKFWMNNPSDFLHPVFPSVLTDFEDGLSVSSLKTANDSKCKEGKFDFNLFFSFFVLFLCFFIFCVFCFVFLFASPSRMFEFTITKVYTVQAPHV